MEILDYIKWRGDLSFAQSEFNLIDNIILCQMSYVELDDLFAYGESITIEEASRLYYEKHTMEEVLASKTFYKKAPILLLEMSKVERFKHAKLHHYINYIDKEKCIQFSVVQIDLSDGTTFVAYRGTDATLIGWKEDLQLSYTNMYSQSLALDYLNHNCDLSRSYRIGGHSKGGTLALYAAYYCNEMIQNNIIAIYNNDGPSLKELTEDDYKKIENKYIKIMPENSMVGIIYDQPGPKVIVKSNRKSVNQHDLMSWQVVGKEFETVDKLSDESVSLKAGIDRFVAEVSAEDKESFVNELFKNFDEANIEQVTDLQSGGISVIVRAIRAVMDLDDSTKETGNKLFQLVLNSEIESQSVVTKIRGMIESRISKDENKAD